MFFADLFDSFSQCDKNKFDWSGKCWKQWQHNYKKKNKGVTSIDKRHFLKHIWKGWNYYGFEIWLVD